MEDDSEGLDNAKVCKPPERAKLSLQRKLAGMKSNLHHYRETEVSACSRLGARF
jgi:hypothetical protein